MKIYTALMLFSFTTIATTTYPCSALHATYVLLLLLLLLLLFLLLLLYTHYCCSRTSSKITQCAKCMILHDVVFVSCASSLLDAELLSLWALSLRDAATQHAILHFHVGFLEVACIREPTAAAHLAIRTFTANPALI